MGWGEVVGGVGCGVWGGVWGGLGWPGALPRSDCSMGEPEYLGRLTKENLKQVSSRLGKWQPSNEGLQQTKRSPA